MQNFETPSVIWLSTVVNNLFLSFFHPLEMLSLPIERPPTILSIPLSPNSSPQWPSPSSFHWLWFSWFLTRSISLGIFLKYHVYFSFFLFNFCWLLCVILNFFLIKTGVEPLYFTSFFLVLIMFSPFIIFFCFYFSINI